MVASKQINPPWFQVRIYANKINHALLYIAEYNCNFKKRPLWFSAHLKLSDTVPPTIPIRAGTVLDFISSQGTIQDRTCPTPSLVPVLKKRNRKSFSFLKFSNFEDAWRWQTETAPDPSKTQDSTYSRAGREGSAESVSHGLEVIRGGTRGHRTNNQPKVHEGKNQIHSQQNGQTQQEKTQQFFPK